MKNVMLDNELFTVNFETTDAFGGKPGELYYAFVERPGELFKASRTRPLTDEEKHADCIRRTGFCAVFLPPNLYDDAERDGYNMRGYVKQRMLPITPGPGVFVIEHPMPTSEQMRDAIKRDVAAGRLLGANHTPLAPSDNPRWDSCRGKPLRKHISEKTCSGKDVGCLQGLNGQCVACFDED